MTQDDEHTRAARQALATVAPLRAILYAFWEPLPFAEKRAAWEDATVLRLAARRKRLMDDFPDLAKESTQVERHMTAALRAVTLAADHGWTINDFAQAALNIAANPVPAQTAPLNTTRAYDTDSVLTKTDDAFVAVTVLAETSIQVSRAFPASDRPDTETRAHRDAQIVLLSTILQGHVLSACGAYSDDLAARFTPAPLALHPAALDHPTQTMAAFLDRDNRTYFSISSLAAEAFNAIRAWRAITPDPTVAAAALHAGVRPSEAAELAATGALDARTLGLVTALNGV